MKGNGRDYAEKRHHFGILAYHEKLDDFATDGILAENDDNRSLIATLMSYR